MHIKKVEQLGIHFLMKHHKNCSSATGSCKGEDGDVEKSAATGVIVVKLSSMHEQVFYAGGPNHRKEGGRGALLHEEG